MTFAIYVINLLVFITVVESVYSAVRTDSLYRAFHNELQVTKMYCRKTVEHVFTKPVQIEGKT